MTVAYFLRVITLRCLILLFLISPRSSHGASSAASDGERDANAHLSAALTMLDHFDERMSHVRLRYSITATVDMANIFETPAGAGKKAEDFVTGRLFYVWTGHQGKWRKERATSDLKEGNPEIIHLFDGQTFRDYYPVKRQTTFQTTLMRETDYLDEIYGVRSISGHIGLGQWLRRYVHLAQVSLVEENERTLLEIQWTFPSDTPGFAGHTHRYILDPAYGYLVTRLVMLMPPGRHSVAGGTSEAKNEVEVARVMKVDDVYLPADSTSTLYKRGATGWENMHETKQTVLEEATFDETVLEATRFTLVFPEGTAVYDGDLEKHYRVGAGGEMIPWVSTRQPATIATETHWSILSVVFFVIVCCLFAVVIGFLAWRRFLARSG